MSAYKRTNLLQRNVLRRFWLNSLFLSLSAILLVACGKPVDSGAIQPTEDRLNASDLSQIQRIHIEEGRCAAVIRHNLSQHGFSIARDGDADALLSVTLIQLRPLRESLPIIQTLGAQTQYRADIKGHKGKILLSLYGQEGSLSFDELCDDISDEIAGKLADYLPLND